VAASLGDLGIAIYQRDGGTAALPYFEQSYEVVERFHGPDHPNTISSLANLGIVLTTVGRHDEARARLEQVLHRLEAGKREGVQRAQILYALGDNESERGQLVDAERWFRRSLDHALATLGEEHPQTATSRYAVGRTLFGQTKFPEAIAELEKVLPFREKVPGGGDQDLGNVLNILGRSYYQVHDYKRAAVTLERSRAILSSVPEDVADLQQLGFVEFTLARALEETGGDLRKGRELALRARKRLAGFEFAGKDRFMALIEKFLARNP
jgi:serine/threonine-protein kinase